jgi:hypothetical protein
MMGVEGSDAFRPAWRLSVYPSAFEAGGCFVGSIPRRSGVRGVRGAAVDAERARSEAGRRARAHLRRYCVANRLNRLGTLTYRGSGCHDPVQVRHDIGRFFREVRAALGGGPLPYVWVPEWHKTDHGLHAHFAVGQYVKQRLLEDIWGHGFVSIKQLSDLPVGSTCRDGARCAAGYLSKYVAKTFTEEGAVLGMHRYDVAQGFQPPVEKIVASSWEELRALSSERLGSVPAREWYSWETPGWQGSSAVWFQWA